MYYEEMVIIYFDVVNEMIQILIKQKFTDYEIN
jgi:hypothetical protein